MAFHVIVFLDPKVGSSFCADSNFDLLSLIWREIDLKVRLTSPLKEAGPETTISGNGTGPVKSAIFSHKPKKYIFIV